MLTRYFRFPGFWSLTRSLLARVALFLAIAPAGSMTMRAQSTKLPRDDTQIWNEMQVFIPLDKKVSLVLGGVVRFGRNVSRPVNERIGAGVSVKAGKYLTLLPFYLRVESQPTSTSHSSEDRITLEATLKFPAGHFTIVDRNRVEFHIHHSAPSFTQYRNRLQLEHPMKLDKFEVDAFVAAKSFTTRSLTPGYAIASMSESVRRSTSISHSICTTSDRTTATRIPGTLTRWG